MATGSADPEAVAGCSWQIGNPVLGNLASVGHSPDCLRSDLLTRLEPTAAQVDSESIGKPVFGQEWFDTHGRRVGKNPFELYRITIYPLGSNRSF